MLFPASQPSLTRESLYPRSASLNSSRPQGRSSHIVQNFSGYIFLSSLPLKKTKIRNCLNFVNILVLPACRKQGDQEAGQRHARGGHEHVAGLQHARIGRDHEALRHLYETAMLLDNCRGRAEQKPGREPREGNQPAFEHEDAFRKTLVAPIAPSVRMSSLFSILSIDSEPKMLNATMMTTKMSME